MTGTVFFITIILASVFGFARFSEAEFTQTHEAEIVQLSLVGVCAILVLYAIFSQSFLLFCLEVAGVAIGLGLGRIVAGLHGRYEERIREEHRERMKDPSY